MTDNNTRVKPLDDEIDGLLRDYADIDESELGEDRFIGHHDIQKAKQAITRLIVEAKIQELQKVLDYIPPSATPDMIRVAQILYTGHRIKELQNQITKRGE